MPRAQNPFGSAFDPERAAAAARVLEAHPDVLLIEDDHAGVVSGAPFSSSDHGARPRWAVIRSVSKFLHPDLRLALMAGDEPRSRGSRAARRSARAGSATCSRRLVVELLPTRLRAHRRRAPARSTRTRRRALIDALAEHGIAAHGRSGLNVWVPVREEAPVVRALLDAGWLVLAGERFRIATAARASGSRSRRSRRDEATGARGALIAGGRARRSPRGACTDRQRAGVADQR